MDVQSGEVLAEALLVAAEAVDDGGDAQRAEPLRRQLRRTGDEQVRTDLPSLFFVLSSLRSLARLSFVMFQTSMRTRGVLLPGEAMDTVHRSLLRVKFLLISTRRGAAAPLHPRLSTGGHLHHLASWGTKLRRF